MIDTLMNVISTAGFFVQVNVQSYVQIRIAGLDSGPERGIFFFKTWIDRGLGYMLGPINGKDIRLSKFTG